MDKSSKKYGVAYENANEVLSNYVDFFRIFPDYFLEMVSSSNAGLYKTFESGAIDEKFDSKDFTEMVKEQVQNYIDDIAVIEIKSDFISAWKNFDDPLAFFQYVMSKEDLRKYVKGLKVEDLRKANDLVKNKQVTGEQAVAHFGFNKNQFSEYEKQMMHSGFEMGDR